MRSVTMWTTLVGTCFLSLTLLVICSGQFTPFPAVVDLATYNNDIVTYIGGSRGLGDHVRAAGDVNGDGLPDFMISSFGDDSTPSNKTQRGVVYLLYGRKTLTPRTTINLSSITSAEGVTILGASAFDGGNGVSLSAVGDVNQDGLDDVLLGFPASNMITGVAYLVYGSKTFPATVDLTSFDVTQGVKLLDKNKTLTQVGYEVSKAGDVNKDGFPDFMISAPISTVYGRKSCGAVFLIFGGKSLPAVIDLNPSLFSSSTGVLLQGAAFNGFGMTIAGAGDINKDGYDDILVSADGASSSNGLFTGLVYLIYGSATLPASLDFAALPSTVGVVIKGAAPSDTLGSGMAVSDINADGFLDLIISALGASVGARSRAGVVYVIYGKSSIGSVIDLSTFTSNDGVIVQGGESNDNLKAVAAVGDINKDGYADFLCGANTSPNGTPNKGTAYVIYGGASLPSTIDVASPTFSSYGSTFVGAAFDDQMGSTSAMLSGVGDVDGSGTPDFILSSWRHNYTHGIAYLVLVDSMPSVSPSSSISGSVSVQLPAATKSHAATRKTHHKSKTSARHSVRPPKHTQKSVAVLPSSSWWLVATLALVSHFLDVLVKLIMRHC